MSSVVGSEQNRDSEGAISSNGAKSFSQSPLEKFSCACIPNTCDQIAKRLLQTVQPPFPGESARGNVGVYSGSVDESNFLH